MFGQFFAWIKSWFVSGTSIDRYDLYQPPERLLYTFWNGEKRVPADPMVLYKRVMAVAPALIIDEKVSRSAIKGAEEAHDKYLDKIRDIFSLKKPANPLDCTGTLSEVETEGLLRHFIGFCEELKKNSNPSATNSMGTSPNSPSSTDKNQPTRSSLPSGSSANAPATAAPGPLPSAPPSPTAPSIPDSNSTAT